MKKEFDIFDAIAFPTMEFTKNAKRKSVRVLGRVLVVVPMLPWTLFAALVIVALGAIAGLLLLVIEWWEKI